MIVHLSDEETGALKEKFGKDSVCERDYRLSGLVAKLYGWPDNACGPVPARDWTEREAKFHRAMQHLDVVMQETGT